MGQMGQWVTPFFLANPFCARSVGAPYFYYCMDIQYFNHFNSIKVKDDP